MRKNQLELTFNLLLLSNIVNVTVYNIERRAVM